MEESENHSESAGGIASAAEGCQDTGKSKGKGRSRGGKGKVASSNKPRQGGSEHIEGGKRSGNASRVSRRDDRGKFYSSNRHYGPTTLGQVPRPCLSNAPEAAAAVQVTCLLCCAENPSYVSVGHCGHIDVCWVCVLRLRALGLDKRCPVCKEDLEEVSFVTSASAKRGCGDLSSLPLDTTHGIRYQDEVICEAAAQLFDYRCTAGECWYSGVTFTSLSQLEDHLWQQHWLQFCQTCLYGRPAFLCEQHVYGSRDIDRHCREGDAASQWGESSTPPVPPHPLCEFCDKRFYCEDDLIQHMHTKHHLCHICERAGHANEFYATFQCLGLHYQDRHHVCAHKDCMRGGIRLIAFASDEELNLHYYSEHGMRIQGDTVCMAPDRKQGMRIQVGPTPYPGHHKGDGRGSKGKSKGKGTPENLASAHVRFMWPPYADKESLDLDDAALWRELYGTSASADTITYERYADRAIRSSSSSSDALEVVAAERGDSCSQGSAAITTAAITENCDKDGRDNSMAFHGDSNRIAQKSISQLHPSLKDLPFECCIADDGPRKGSRSCLNALHSVAKALIGDDSQQRPISSEAVSQMEVAVHELNAMQVEGLHCMRAHLDSAGNLCHSTLDWEPLERVLSLQPLFFLLLRSRQTSQNDEGQGTADRSKNGKEDKSSPEIFQKWIQWKGAAQEAVLSLSEIERHHLLFYTRLCLRRRAELAAVLEQEVLEASFPTLLVTTPSGSPQSRPLKTPWGDQRQVSPKDEQGVGGPQCEGFQMVAVEGDIESPAVEIVEDSYMTLDDWVNAKGKPKLEPQEFEGVTDSSFPSLPSAASPAIRPKAWRPTAAQKNTDPSVGGDASLVPQQVEAEDLQAVCTALPVSAVENMSGPLVEIPVSEQPSEPAKPKEFRLEDLQEEEQFPGLPSGKPQQKKQPVPKHGGNRSLCATVLSRGLDATANTGSTECSELKQASFLQECNAGVSVALIDEPPGKAAEANSRLHANGEMSGKKKKQQRSDKKVVLAWG